jgi:CheY-like chemotaxis protein
VLTQQLLAYSRKQVLQPKDVDVNAIVTALEGMLVRLIREDITLTCELAPEPAVVRIDPAQLEQVILNLVLNARDAVPGCGSIRIEVARVRLVESDVPVDLPRAAEYVRLRVADSGVGITPEVRTHLFEPFFTTKEPGKGSGLGLASVYGIVRQSQGFISVDSEPGHGAVFTMHFPALAAPAAVHTAARTEAPPSETILLVEDEPGVRAMIAAVLRRQGYTVLEAATPGAAIDLFERSSGRVDLLLTDVVMPEMNGPALAQRLVGVQPDLRVLFISGYTGVAGPIDAGTSNVGFLTKPFQGSILAAKIREVLSPASPAREP